MDLLSRVKMENYITSHMRKKKTKTKGIQLNYLGILLSNLIKITMLKMLKVLTLMRDHTSFFQKAKIIDKVLMMTLF